MTGIEFLRAPGTTVEQIVDIIAEQCPPIAIAECDGLSCRKCWLAWLTMGEPPKETGPSDKQTAPVEAPTPYRPPHEAIRRATERVKEGHMEYATTALIRAHDEALRRS